MTLEEENAKLRLRIIELEETLKKVTDAWEEARQVIVDIVNDEQMKP